jgi:sucrose-phosphate synthase
VSVSNLFEIDAHYHFARRIMAERLSMNHSGINITSTYQERYEQYGHVAYQHAVDVTDDKRFAVIPPGVNLRIFDSGVTNDGEAQTQAYIKTMLTRDLDNRRRTLPAIIASSRLDPKKNHIALVRAYSLSTDLQNRANLVIFTSGMENPLRENLVGASVENEVLTQIREVVDRAHLWGKVSAFSLRGQAALAAAYRFFAQRGSVFALTALYEPFGLAPLEAAAAGLPVVVTKNGGPSESLHDSGIEYGILVDPTDTHEIAQALLRLLTSQSVWGEFALRGHQRVLDHYTWERTAAHYLDYLHDISLYPDKRHPANRLPVPAYFHTANDEDDFSVDTLSNLYFG